MYSIGCVDAPAVEALNVCPRTLLERAFETLQVAGHDVLRCEFSDRGLFATRIEMGDGSEFCELLAIRDSIFVVTEHVRQPRRTAELLRVNGLLSFHVRLVGELLVGQVQRPSLQIGAPSLFAWHQPAMGTDIAWTLPSGSQSVTLLCQPEFIRAALSFQDVDENLEPADMVAGARHRRLPVSAEIISAGRELVSSRWSDRLRLLQREAKALEIFCRILSAFDEPARVANEEYSERDHFQLHRAREILSSRFNPVPTINALAREVGINETKLKRGFRQVFGKTVFDYGHHCRMEHAMRLLHDRRLPISLVANAVGYSHQSSFASAFKSYFGYQPKKVRRPAPATRFGTGLRMESAC